MGLLRRKAGLRMVALLAIRNEELYLERCLRHLAEQGFETYVIDNDSDDASAAIAKSFLGRGVMGIERYSYEGYFDHEGILKRKEQLAREIKSDWFLNADADEIRESPLPYRTLKEGIADADRMGYNAINFDEFVFAPTSDTESFEGRDYVREMKYYYYFIRRKKIRRLNAWKKTRARINLSERGGHVVQFRRQKILPRNFVLRHYIALSREHAIRKYGTRVFSQKELERGWHGWRARTTPETIRMPARELLKEYRGDGVWNRTEPFLKHLIHARNTTVSRQRS